MGNRMQDRWHDFGITELASHFFQGWWRRGQSPEDVIAEARDGSGVSYCEHNVQDALLLVGSPLSGEQLTALWVSAANHDPTSYGMDGREWLLKIVDIMSPVLSDAGVRVSTEAFLDDRADAVRDVLDAIQCFSIAVNFSRNPVDESFLRDVLSDLARAGRPELTLRFLISAMITFQTEIDESVYRRLQEVSHHFDYDESVVERLEFLL